VVIGAMSWDFTRVAGLLRIRRALSCADNAEVRTRRVGLAGTAAVLLLSAPAAASPATPTATIGSETTTSSAGGLSISVPSAVSFGSRSVGGGTITGRLGAVTVATGGGGLVGSTGWLTKVSTSGFRSDADPSQVIAPSAVSYSAGAPTALAGVNLSACVPGAPTALGSPATAYSCSGLSLITGTSVAWNPTVTIEVSASHTRGTYRGTITHSVA
jgi:hypothetical protein